MRILLSVILTMLSLFASEDEFVFGDISTEATSKNSYFNSLGMPNVYVTTQCRERCSGDNCCWDVIRNQNSEIIKSFSSSDSVSRVSNGRYKDVAYLLYSRTYGPKKDRKTKYYLVDQNHKNFDVPYGSTLISSIISKDRDLVSVGVDGIYKNGSKILSSQTIETAKISNNPDGDLGVVAVLEDSDEVVVSELSKWIKTGIVLSFSGDRDGILSVEPKDANKIYTAVYKYTNIYNKGLVGSYVNFDQNISKHGWIINSAKRNVGFDPQIYITQNKVYVATKDSTNTTDISITLPLKEFEQDLGKEYPEHTDGFEYESIANLLVGSGFVQTNWYANSSIDDVSDDSDMEYGEVKYDIGASIYKSLYFEGRVNSTRLAISYLQNEAKKAGGLTAKASKILNILFDFNGLISDSSSLRLKMTKGDVNGVATFSNKNSEYRSITTQTDELKTEFESQLTTYGVYVMMERGLYGGLEYTNYTTPSAVGFSNSYERVEHYGMDPNFEISTYSLVLGYDEISYAKRYEVDLSRLYTQVMAGIGWANYSLSSDIKSKVENLSSKSINSTNSFAFSADLELGYIYQQRFKMFKGLGYSLLAGYRARGSYNGSGQSDDSDIKSNELELEMTRYDIWHGPFIKANIVF